MLEQAEFRDLLCKFVISRCLREPWPERMVLADIDSVLKLWFDSPASMAHFHQQSHYLPMVAPREGSFADMGSIRTLVTQIHVIHDDISFQPPTTQPFPFSWG